MHFFGLNACTLCVVGVVVAVDYREHIARVLTFMGLRIRVNLHALHM